MIRLMLMDENGLVPAARLGARRDGRVVANLIKKALGLG
jgi:hypothetical protein